jgi:hypothetical protein
MKLINNPNLLILLSLILLVSSCRKTSTEILEKTALKEVGTELIEKITKNSAKELSELGLSKEATEFVAKNFDDDLTKQFLKVASENKTFLTYAKSNPAFINTWKTFSETNFASNPNQIRWINSAIDQEKYSFKKIGQSLELIDSKTNKLIATFEKDKITATAGTGYKDLNPFLNMRNKHPLLPNAKYEIQNANSNLKTYFHSDAYGRVEKMMCPLVSNKNKILRSPQEQGLSKILKDGKVLFDEAGNPIRSKTGYIRSTDDGGHLLANLFGGPSEQINYLPMSNDVNKKSFKKLEVYLSKCIDDGKKVSEFTVIPKFKGKSGRPDKIYISYYIDGKYFSQKIMNL